MARVYMITEPEMQALLDSLELHAMLNNNHLEHKSRAEKMTPEEHNRLRDVHRAFHLICTRWAQEMGFKGGRY